MGDVKTICPYCGVGCGMFLTVEDGKVTGVKPQKDHPISKGTLCPKGATADQFIDHEDRLTDPLIKRNGEFVKVNWDEAYDYIASELHRIQDKHGRDSVAMISTTRGTQEENWVAQKFARAVLGTNNLDQCQRICHSATVTGLSEVFGTGAMSNAVNEFLEPGAEALMVVGSNAAGSHPIIWSQWIMPTLRKGIPLIVIDPRRTQVVTDGERAGAQVLHLAARPGSEVALFNAMCQHIIAQDLQDKEYIEARCENFEEFAKSLDRYTPEMAESICGVPAEDIKKAAEIYAKAKPGSITYGIGITEHITGTNNIKALANLPMITGNMGKAGGGMNALRGQNNVQGATDLVRPESLPGYQKWDNEEAIQRFQKAWGVEIPRPQGNDYFFASHMWDNALSGDLKAIYVMGQDFALSEGNSKKVHKALESLDLLVVQDIFMNKTAEFAHVVLPAASYAEKEGTFVNTERRVQLVRKAIEPLHNSKTDLDILCELSERMGYPMNYDKPEDVFEEMRSLMPIYGGITYKRMEENEGIQWPCPDEDHPGTPTLHIDEFTRGKGLLSSVNYKPPAEETDEAYPLLLTSGRSFMQYNAGTMTRRTKSGIAEPENYVQISPEDAERLGIEDKQPVRVSSRRGEVEVKAKIFPVVQGVVWMPMHYEEAPTNLLTIDAYDPDCGITEVKVCAVKIEPIEVAVTA
jgi:formate dehydrogenase alpha subunit